MKLSLAILAGAIAGFAASASPASNALDYVKNHIPVFEKRTSNKPFRNRELQKRASKYMTDATSQFAVDGTKIPDVAFDIGESYAGLLPISADPDESRKLFFWFFPSTNPLATEEIGIWWVNPWAPQREFITFRQLTIIRFNGGPGCSSLSGLLTENGPFTWEAGTLDPVQNPYTWVNLTNMVWVEQPVGVGYTQGVPNITNEVELAQEFIGFYKQFATTFALQNYKVYVTGESYAGFYVPYVADAFIGANDTEYYNLAGVAINDPIIGDETNQQQVVIAPYVHYWENLMYLNDSFLEIMDSRAADCGYTAYLEKYLTFPPPQEAFPVLTDPYSLDNASCDIFDDVYNAELLSNPCFNIYHITDTCPHLWDVLGIVNPGDYSPPDEVVYFNRSDVQAAIHAPVGTNWMQCTMKNVFGNGSNNQSLSDQSPGPANDGVLARVIEYTNNTFIGNGNLDFLLNTNGTLLAIQNMTWGGLQGFQASPTSNELFVPYHPEYNGGALASDGIVGSWGTERGLTFYQVQLAGHELPGYAPGAAYRVVEALLGRVENIGVPGDFTTQTGNYTGTGTIYKDKSQQPLGYPKGGVFRHAGVGL